MLSAYQGLQSFLRSPGEISCADFTARTCRPTYIITQEFLLLSKDLPSPCRAGGLFLLLHNKESTQHRLRQFSQKSFLLHSLMNKHIFVTVGPGVVKEIVSNSFFVKQMMPKQIYSFPELYFFLCQILYPLYRLFFQFPTLYRKIFFCLRPPSQAGIRFPHIRLKKQIHRRCGTGNQ